MNEKLLEYFKSDDIHLIQCEHKWCDVYGYEKSQMKKDLIDYITNLQQENEKLRFDIRYWENKWQNTRFANNQVKVLQDTIIKSANNTNRAIEQTEIYKSRCEKAIEYIKENYPTSTINYQDDKYKLINILNGSDENETNS